MFAITKADSAPAWVKRAAGVPAFYHADLLNNRGWYRGERAISDILNVVRGSGGYYPNPDGTLTNVTDSNVLRYGLNGGLVEEQRTNYCGNSQKFASWGVISGTATDNQTTAPDGTLTASKYVNANVGGNQLIFKSAISLTSGNTYAYSMYQKAAGYNFGNLCVYDGVAFTSAIVDLTNGAVTNAGNTGRLTVVSATADTLANGWYRIKFIFSTNTTANCTIYTGASNANTFSGGLPTTFTANGTSGIYCWGAQFEVGSNVTSYVVTPTSGTAGRNADVVRLVASGNPQLPSITSIMAGTGAFYCSFLATGVNGIYYISTSAGAQSQLYKSGATTFAAYDGTNSGGSLTEPAAGTVCKAVRTWGGGLMRGCLNNGAIVSGNYDGSWDTASNYPIIGSYAGSSGFPNSYIYEIAFFDRYISDGAMGRLTT